MPVASQWNPSLDRRTLLKVGGAGLALAGLGTLAACSPSGGSSSGGAQTLKMLYFGDQKSASALAARLAPQIKKLDKKATIQITAVNGTDWNDFFSKVLTQIAAGSPPDIVGVATEG